VRYLTEDGVQRLLAACDEHLRPIVITALRTGMRRGEILNLQWTEVGFTKRPDHNRGAIRMIDKALDRSSVTEMAQIVAQAGF
jgi:integrase